MKKTQRRATLVVLTSVVFAVVVVLGLPTFIRSRINAGLVDMKEGYSGHVENLSIDWLTPGVTLHELRVELPKREVGAPFLLVKRLEVEVFFRGPLRPRIGLRFVEPVVNFVDGPTPVEEQWGPPFSLKDLAKALPLDLGFLELADLDVHLRNFRATPQVDAYLQKVQVSASPLDHCIETPPVRCEAKVELEGTLMAGADLRAQARMSYDLEFALDATATVRDVQMIELNPVLVHYVQLSVEGGELDLGAKVRLRGPRYRITLSPDSEDLTFTGAEPDKTRSVRSLLIAALSGIIERHDEDWSIVIDGISGKDNMKWALDRRPPGATPAVASP